jgi:ankyrin repeat protein
MHLLFTDPSTAPRTDVGRVAFGVMYAASVIGLFVVLERWSMPSFYDKLLGVPVLNLMIQAIDRAAQWPGLRRLDLAAVLPGLSARKKNLALIAVWCVGFVGASALHVNMPEADGTTALHKAAQDGRLAAARMLLLAGADANASDGYGGTPLSLAISEGNGPMIEALVAAGADPNALAANGLTMLMLASRSSPAAVQALLNAGADVHARDPVAGETALVWARKAGNPETIRLLMRAGAIQ